VSERDILPFPPKTGPRENGATVFGGSSQIEKNSQTVLWSVSPSIVDFLTLSQMRDREGYKASDSDHDKGAR
jgi:hypothetical protein